jgi:hypothetical protein
VVRSDSFGVTLTGTETQLKNVKVVQNGDQITISYDINLSSILAVPFQRMHARIAIPDLRELAISGAARAWVRGFHTSEKFALSVSGASVIDVTDMSVGSMDLDLSGASRVDGDISSAGDSSLRIVGASRITLNGAVQNVAVDAAGASHIDLDHLTVRNAKIKLTGASHCLINMNGRLDATLEGASHLDYRGEATMGDVKTSGAATLKRQ